jgi:hypothetical protein
VVELEAEGLRVAVQAAVRTQEHLREQAVRTTGVAETRRRAKKTKKALAAAALACSRGVLSSSESH